MAFPTNNVHRRSRRTLGRGQTVPTPQVTVAVAAAPNTNTAQLTFSSPVVINGTPNMGIVISGGAATQTAGVVISPTVYQITYNPGMATLVGRTWTLPTPLVGAQTYQGGGVTGGSGTF